MVYILYDGIDILFSLSGLLWIVDSKMSKNVFSTELMQSTNKPPIGIDLK